MAETETLADRFEAHRARLHAVAYRMLGAAAEADDAVQETWLRLSRAETADIENLGAWLTTVIARLCLDVLRARKIRHEEAIADDPPGAAPERQQPDAELQIADSVGVALLVVLETLAPAERIAFVLHDLFDVSFDEIAPIVGRNPAAARQLASRARRRVQGASPTRTGDRLERSGSHPNRRIVDAFLAAAREGDFEALLVALDPEVVLRADPVAIETAAARAAQGAPAPSLAAEVRGARAVAEALGGRARGARPALVGGVPGAAWAPDGVPRAAFAFTVAKGRIVAIEIVMDPARLRALDVVV
jgi:RNA polymerase sigma-70 factor (ECF subfamily)